MQRLAGNEVADSSSSGCLTGRFDRVRFPEREEQRTSVLDRAGHRFDVDVVLEELMRG